MQHIWSCPACVNPACSEVFACWQGQALGNDSNYAAVATMVTVYSSHIVESILPALSYLHVDRVRPQATTAARQTHTQCSKMLKAQLVTVYSTHIVDSFGSCLALCSNGLTCQAAAIVVVSAASHPKTRN